MNNEFHRLTVTGEVRGRDDSKRPQADTLEELELEAALTFLLLPPVVVVVVVLIIQPYGFTPLPVLCKMNIPFWRHLFVYP